MEASGAAKIPFSYTMSVKIFTKIQALAGNSLTGIVCPLLPLTCDSAAVRPSTGVPSVNLQRKNYEVGLSHSDGNLNETMRFDIIPRDLNTCHYMIGILN